MQVAAMLLLLKLHLLGNSCETLPVLRAALCRREGV
jgi:hypothetical protein